MLLYSEIAHLNGTYYIMLGLAQGKGSPKGRTMGDNKSSYDLHSQYARSIVIGNSHLVSG